MSHEGVEVEPMKTAAVQDWPTPRTVKDVQAFLGLASYYRRHIHNFAAVAAPLTGLTKKDAKCSLKYKPSASATGRLSTESPKRGPDGFVTVKILNVKR